MLNWDSRPHQISFERNRVNKEPMLAGRERFSKYRVNLRLRFFPVASVQGALCPKVAVKAARRGPKADVCKASSRYSAVARLRWWGPDRVSPLLNFLGTDWSGPEHSVLGIPRNFEAERLWRGVVCRSAAFRPCGWILCCGVVC